MSSRHLVDPELLEVLDAFPQFDFSAEMLPAMRQGLAAMFNIAEAPVDPDVSATRHRITSADGSMIDLLVYQPVGATTPCPAVLHIHGGGYVIGSAAMSAASNLALAKDLQCVVASVDYRLAPDTVHPGPVEDCYAALQWLHGHADELGVDAARIAVAGESAGGGLAAALALMARDRDGPALCHQHLIYPMIDDRTCVRPPHPFTGEFVWTPKSNHFGWQSLLGLTPGSDGVSPYAAAARADDLTGLPSTFIAVGSLDLFLDEDVDFALRLTRAGVSTELHVHPGAYHGFERAADAAITLRASQLSRAALRKALGLKT